MSIHSQRDIFIIFFPAHRFCSRTSSGKNWDLTAALSDFEQLRQVHAGSLSYSYPQDRQQTLTDHKDMTRVGRPLLHRQDDVVQGEAALHSDLTPPEIYVGL